MGFCVHSYECHINREKEKGNNYGPDNNETGRKEKTKYFISSPSILADFFFCATLIYSIDIISI